MIPLISAYECKVDSKFRLPLPTGLQRQWASVLEDGFILKRSVFQPCIQMYPKADWMEVMQNELGGLNRNNKEIDRFVRAFTASIKEVDVDATGRVQISRDLIAFAGITKEVVLHPSINIIEIWDKEQYEAAVDINDDDLAALTEKILGGKNTED